MNCKPITRLAIAAILPLAATTALAESACKGLAESACQGAQACTWVKGYTRKDGREVTPYCRAQRPPKDRQGAAKGATPPAAG